MNLDWIKFALTPEELAPIRQTDMRLGLGERGYDVFGMDGKFVCRIEGVEALGGIKSALKMKGVNPGMYVIRGLDSKKAIKINTIK